MDQNKFRKKNLKLVKLEFLWAIYVIIFDEIADCFMINEG